MRDLSVTAKWSKALGQIFMQCLVLFLAAGLLCAGSTDSQKQKKKKGKPAPEESADKPLIPIPDDRAIDALISEMLGAWQLGDLAGLHKYIADDVVVVSGAWEPPVAGWDNYAQAYQRQRDRTQNVVLDRTNTYIKVVGSVSWVSYQWEFRGVVDGSPMTVRGQTTLILQKQKDRWMIVHNHTSLAQEAAGPQRLAPSQQKPPGDL
ncbi:MAG TPA: nuclear transport factor 2 family protein [Candidatus Dormibacteraeota bacterium]|nr:nuclear transport factor 2 family protein [Candidatus Dormibacteraeota bacterium]